MKIAIIGHIPYDRYTLHDGSRYTGFGGILYGAAALARNLEPNDEIVLVSRVGERITPDIRRLLERYASIKPMIDTVSEYGWVVEATYLDGENRRERLLGSVPPWSAAELLEVLAGCDAAILNMVTGFEMALLQFEKFAREAPPLLLDFHSLALGRDETGLRYPRPYPEPEQWCRLATIVQMNRVELRSVLPDQSPIEGVAAISQWGPTWAAVTDGSSGAWVAEKGNAAHVPAVDPTADPVDPTGCGDVFGATLLVEMLRGTPLLDAARRAQALARKNADNPGILPPEC
jgi:sugar/nucleoside kinase (ribokinase family)